MDNIIRTRNEDAIGNARALATKESNIGGIMSGTNALSTRPRVYEPELSNRIVTVMIDCGWRYLDFNLFNK